MRRAPGRDDDDPRPVGLVLGLGAVEGHALVVVVVGVEQAVPQADVPEHALGRAPADDESLVIGEFERAHGIGGVAGGPAEGRGRHRIGRVDRIRRAEGDGDDAGLLAHPGRGGTNTPRQVGVVLAVGLGRVVCLDAPSGTPSGQRVVEVVPGDGGDGVRLEADPADARFAGIGRRDDDVDGAVGVPRHFAAVHGSDDSSGVAPVVRSAVHGERHVDSVTGVEAHPVRAGRIDRRVAVEGIGIVSAPLHVRTNDLDEAGPGLVSPHVDQSRNLQDRQDPLVCLEQGGLVIGQLLDHVRVGRLHLGEQLIEGRFCLSRHLSPGIRRGRRS